MQRETIRDFNQKIIGYIEVDEQGNKTVKTFLGKVLGYYRKSRDVTITFLGTIVSRGDCANSLLFREDLK